ncbi:MAG: carboxylating nicotinate-nucleotide diphosphorylase [Ectothiorhodospira sp.]
MPTTIPDPLLHTCVRTALEEDIGSGDLTAALIPEKASCRAQVVCKETAVICGRPWFDAVFHHLDPGIDLRWSVTEGEAVEAGDRLVTLEGPARAILTGERTALNFLQTLSATATRTRRYVDAVAGTGARILDTRKTLPGLRRAQKYAVACGGGLNHRMGLHDAILIKENHILAAGSIAAAVATARQRAPGVWVEVETENLDEVDQALAAGADVIMLDDFDLAGMRQAVARVAGRCPLEASGGVDLEQVRAIALTGVDRISVGALTKHLQAVDLSLRLD